MERFEESAFCREIEAFRLPRYADLPDFRLYIDQLIALVEKTLAPLMGAGPGKSGSPPPWWATMRARA